MRGIEESDHDEQKVENGEEYEIELRVIALVVDGDEEQDGDLHQKFGVLRLGLRLREGNVGGRPIYTLLSVLEFDVQRSEVKGQEEEQ